MPSTWSRILWCWNPNFVWGYLIWPWPHPRPQSPKSNHSPLIRSVLFRVLVYRLARLPAAISSNYRQCAAMAEFKASPSPSQHVEGGDCRNTPAASGSVQFLCDIFWITEAIAGREEYLPATEGAFCLYASSKKELKLCLKESWKLFPFPACDFIWYSNFVVLAVRNSDQKVSRSYELSHRIYSTAKFKDFDYWLTQFPLLHSEVDSLAFATNSHLW